MPFELRSSHRRYLDYRRRARRRRREQQTSQPAQPIARGAVPKVREEGDIRLWVDRAKFRHRTFIGLFKAFWEMVGEHRLITLASMGVLTLAVIISLAPIYGTKIIFDNVLRDHPLPIRFPIPLPTDRFALLAIVCGGMIALTIIAQIFTVWSRWQATRAGKRVTVAVRKRVYDHAVRLPLHRVYDLKSGGVASILREDAGGVGQLVFSMMYNPWRAVVQIFGCLLVLAWVDWRLLLGSLLILPIIYLTHKTWISRIRPIYRDIRATRQQIDAQATEAFGGMRIVRSFSREKSESSAFTNHNHLMIRQELLAWWWARGIDVAWAIIIPLATACLLWYGGARILNNQAAVAAGTMQQAQALTVGDLVMFMSYLASLLGPIATLANSATTLQNNLAGLDRIIDLLDEPIEMPPAPDAVAVRREEVEGRITLEDVGFSYAESEHAVLQGIDLEVKPGEMIALVGPSGAGKTTFCNLIARFYDPTRGIIRLDGRDLRKITLESYRRLLGIVEQDTFLFDGTIAQNIAYGSRHATREEIAHAARLAHAHDFIMEIDGGYDALIGERGVKLSGGQRQRITIARAILADPKILILDEATSNLDTESERLIQASLYNLMAGRTSFIIAHRLSTITNADRILVLENGKIIEQGRHDELMAISGRYREMVEMQTHPPASPVVRPHARTSAPVGAGTEEGEEP